MTDSYNPIIDPADELRDQELQALLEAQEQESALQPSEAGKQGPDFVPGERETAEAALEQAEQQAPKDIYGNSWPPNFEEERQQSAEIAEDVTVGTIEGLIDTALGLTTIQEKGYELLGGIPNALGLDPNNQFKPPMPMTWLKNQWDKANPINEDEPLHKTIRKVSGVAIPTILGGGIATGAVKATPWFLGLSGKAKLATEIATHLGIDMLVTTASTSATDETLATLTNEYFGWHLPWATKNTDSPDVKYWKQMFETGALSTGVDLVGVLFNTLKPTQFLAKTDEAQAFLAKRAARETEVTTEALTSPTLKEVNRQIDEILEARPNIAEEIAQSKNFDDPDWVRLDELTSQESKLVTAEILEAPPGAFTESAQTNYLRGQAQTEEAVRRFEADLTGVNGYDPFINSPSIPTAKAIAHPQADPWNAVVDHTVMDKWPTLNPRPAPVVTESFQKDFMRAADGSERATQLQDLFYNMPAQIDAIRDTKTLTAADLEQTVNKLATSILGTDVKTFAKDLNALKTNIQNGQKFLDDESFVALAQAFKQAFDSVYNPNNIRASALMVKQAGYTVSDASRVANSLEDFVDVTRQTEIALDNLELLATEIRANQYIAGYSLQVKKLVKSVKDNPRVAIKLQEHREAFERGLQIEKEKARATVTELKRIALEYPEYRKAFTKAFDATNGEVDTLSKLFTYAQENLGIIHKAIRDNNPEVPSLILQGLMGVRYNNILTGLAALRALAGNSITTAAKPISALLGSAPAAVAGDAYQFKRALASYSGFRESMMRARKVMNEDWKRAVSNPQEAMRRGRADLDFSADRNLEVMESMIEGWEVNGEQGKIALTRIAQGLTFWNNNPVVRAGVNAMYAIDGFTNSMMASASARARAFDELYDASNGAFNKVEFEKMQQKLYDEAFDANGLLTDKAAKHASSEIALNLDSKVVSDLENMMSKWPALKTIMMFPRTGINGVELAWSFTPISGLSGTMTKANRLFRAKTDDQILAVLAEHGIDKMDKIAFQALKSEYTGRQIMGSALVTSVALWALDGNLTGNGPQDRGELQRMIKMGWKPLSFRVPGTDQWISYKGFEPFQLLLGLTADTVYQLKRVDQSVGEDWMRKLGAAVSFNITNSTFLSGFEPLMSLMAGDETAHARFFAMQIDSNIPGTGIRSILSNLITPQLKDVQRDISGYLANKNKYLFNDDALLKDWKDVYTGEPIRYFDPVLSRVNAFLPFFKMNGGMEPWRQWLLETGWDNLQMMRVNPISKEPIEPKDQQWINNYIGENNLLIPHIEKLKNNPHGWWDKKLKDYVKGRENKPQSEFPIKQSVIHQELNRIHQRAFNRAWDALEARNQDAVSTGVLKRLRDKQLNRGDTQGAIETWEKIKEIQGINK